MGLGSVSGRRGSCCIECPRKVTGHIFSMRARLTFEAANLLSQAVHRCRKRDSSAPFSTYSIKRCAMHWTLEIPMPRCSLDLTLLRRCAVVNLDHSLFCSLPHPRLTSSLVTALAYQPAWSLRLLHLLPPPPPPIPSPQTRSTRFLPPPPFPPRQRSLSSFSPTSSSWPRLTDHLSSVKPRVSPSVVSQNSGTRLRNWTRRRENPLS